MRRSPITAHPPKGGVAKARAYPLRGNAAGMVAGLPKEPAVKLHLTTTTRRRLTSMRAIRSPRWLAPRALAVAGLALVFGATLGLSGNSAEASGVSEQHCGTAGSGVPGSPLDRDPVGVSSTRAPAL